MLWNNPIQRDLFQSPNSDTNDEMADLDKTEDTYYSKAEDICSTVRFISTAFPEGALTRGKLADIPSSMKYHIYTLWLFTRSDMKTFVIPETLFGIFGALSGPLMTTNPNLNLSDIILQIPKVLLWTWLNTLVFDFSNQRLPESVQEDTLNKPYRPLAAGRIGTEQTRRLLLAAIPLVLAITYYWLGSGEETALLFCLNWMYNDLGGSDEDFLTRNAIIGAAYFLYGSGALRVASVSKDEQYAMTRTGHIWSCVIGAVIFTTMQIQDMKDQEGDKARDRKTAPLVLGDWTARWTIAIPVIGWSVACPLFWGLGLYASAAPVLLGLLVATRVVVMRNFQADKQTWKFWAYWLAVLYTLPVIKAYKDTSV